MDLELKGKVALVTGGSRGIGKAIARQLALEGCDVAIAARNTAQSEQTAQELAKETGRRVLAFTADVGHADQVNKMVADVAKTFGRLDILINNAGFPGGLAGGPLAKVTDEAMLSDLNTKTLGYLRCARAAAPFMQKNNYGRIIHIGGTSARQSGTYSAGMRNIAIVHLSKTLSDELGQVGITSNVLHPATTRTPYFENLVTERARRESKSAAEVETDIGRTAAIRRVVDAAEIANIVAFLASPKSTPIPGEVIGVGGGPGRAVTI